MAKISGTAGDDGFWGTERADQIKLYGGNDWADGGSGNDSIGGGLGDDYLEGGWGDDRIWGAEGNDSLFGYNGADDNGGGVEYLSGGPGDDYIGLFYGTGHAVGGSGNDTIWHYGFGAARADGGTGDDLIINNNGISTGGAGNDQLYARLADPASDGSELIPGTGHAAVDMTGGRGADIFSIAGDARWQGNTAEIRDFHAAEGDKLSLAVVGWEGDWHGTGETFVGLDANHDNQLTGADFASGGAVYDDGSGLLIGLNGNLLHMSGVHAIDWGMVV